MKRLLPEEYFETHGATKRFRKDPPRGSPDRLSGLTDELLLRVLSFLPVSILLVCERVSRRLQDIAGDAQLWKSAYYSRFVRPRASRIPGIREEGSAKENLLYSSRTSKWLHDEILVRRGRETDWKRQYRLRHNWARGSCKVREVEVADRPPAPPLLVQLHGMVAVTADGAAGLAAWNVKGRPQPIVASPLTFADGSRPTSLTIGSHPSEDDHLDLAVGFEDGRFSIHALDLGQAVIADRYSHGPSSNGTISALAFSAPYLLTLTAGNILSLYRFASLTSCAGERLLEAPRLVAALRAHTVWPPVTLSLRASSSEIIASIAYALPTYLSGWSVGVQELRISPEGTMTESRIATAIKQGFVPLSPTRSPSARSSGSSTPTSSSGTGASPTASKPTSLSYTHPYLLTSHPDNTLTLYLVTSDASRLMVSEGRRLWGHTSSVSGAHVGGRGKAVSVSSHGNELRVWELEGGVSAGGIRRGWPARDSSVQIRPERQGEDDLDSDIEAADDLPLRGLAATLHAGKEEIAHTTKGWVGFDDEKVVVLREKALGSQALFVYDFT